MGFPGAARLSVSLCTLIPGELIVIDLMRRERERDRGRGREAAAVARLPTATDKNFPLIGFVTLGRGRVPTRNSPLSLVQTLTRCRIERQKGCQVADASEFVVSENSTLANKGGKCCYFGGHLAPLLFVSLCRAPYQGLLAPAVATTK